MSITTLSRERLAVLATGAVALATVGLAASAHAGTDSPAAATGSTSGPEIHFWTLGEAKAGATIDVFAECGGFNKNGIVVTTAEVGGSPRPPSPRRPRVPTSSVRSPSPPTSPARAHSA